MISFASLLISGFGANAHAAALKCWINLAKTKGSLVAALVVELGITGQAAALGLAGVFLPYFWLNFSMRPAVSRVFCLPV